jgi:thiamine kinase-like enzyme
MTTKTLHVLMPAFDPLPADVCLTYGVDYGPFVPMGGKPLYVHLYEQLTKTQWWDKVCIHIITKTYAGPPINQNNVNTTISWISKSRGVADTLQQGLKQLVPRIATTDSRDTQVLVCMGDTLFVPDERPRGIEVYMMSANRLDAHRWTLYKQDGKNCSLYRDRNFDVGHDIVKDLWAFRGALFFGTLEQAMTALRVRRKKSVKDEEFFVSIASLLNKRGSRMVTHGKWKDFGHIDTFYQSKMQLLNVMRHNRVEYEFDRNVIHKWASDDTRQDFDHQCAWMLNAPQRLKPFLPNIYSYEGGRLTMEALPYPTMSDLLLQHDIPQYEWELLFERIATVQTLMRRHEAKVSDPLSMCMSMYIDKTLERIGQYPPELATLLDRLLQERDLTLERVISKVTAHLSVVIPDKLSIVHGDLCASNILYDRKSRTIKLIDPRGAFGVPGLYGDPAYDLAKLRHSVLGGYDFILNGWFKILNNRIEVFRNKVAIDSFVRFQTNHFPQTMIRRARLIEPLLFLSMVPLHGDEPKRQYAFLLNGLERLLKVLDNKPITVGIPSDGPIIEL